MTRIIELQNKYYYHDIYEGDKSLYDELVSIVTERDYQSIVLYRHDSLHVRCELLLRENLHHSQPAGIFLWGTKKCGEKRKK